MESKTCLPLVSSRRQFLKQSSTAALGGVLAAHLGSSFGANDETLKIGLIGCGGRGTGAASQALHADKNVVLTAVGDVFSSQIERSLGELGRQAPDQVRVEADHHFVGLDAYQKV